MKTLNPIFSLNVGYNDWHKYTLFVNPNFRSFCCRHERVQHEQDYQTTQADETGTSATNNDKDAKADSIFNYHNARIQCGLLFLNIIDAIKEGDGNRLMRCYKVVLLFMYKFKHIKYAYILLLLFAKLYALLPEKEAESLIHNRFVNKKGKKGGNIPLDLHMEHFNLFLKTLLQAMGGKITEAAAQRCARSMTVLNEVRDAFYSECDKVHRSGYHGSKNTEETVKSMANDLLQGNVFQCIPGRESYQSFKKFKSNILDIDYRDFFTWVNNHLKQWKGVYETPRNQ